MLTAQLLTKNNATTVGKALESIMGLNAKVVVGDLGSTDKTIDICEGHGIQVRRLAGTCRNEARNLLMADGWNMMMEPWEIFSSGHQHARNISRCSYAKIIREKTINKEIRLWNEGAFVNPIYERLDVETPHEANVVFYCIGARDYADDMRLIEEWKEKEPFSSAPYYYQASTLLALGQHEEFLKVAQHYLFLDSKSMSSVMTRYYLAYVFLTKKEVRPALQNLNLCLCARPLMAEFWCLMADVYYHLLKKFDQAKEFYENALILGARRLSTDKWPMDISKYGKYPRMMIKSCEKITESWTVYRPL